MLPPLPRYVTLSLVLLLFRSQVISLLGGFTIAILDFILPPLLHLRIVCYRTYRALPLVPLTQRHNLGAVDSDIELPRRLATNIPFTDDRADAGFASLDSEADLDCVDSLNSVKWGQAHRTGGPVRRMVYFHDYVLLAVGTMVCVVSTVMSIKSIHQKLSSGQAC